MDEVQDIIAKALEEKLADGIDGIDISEVLVEALETVGDNIELR